MKKLLVSCIVCLCAGVAMGQVPQVIDGAGKAMTGATKGVSQLAKLTIPLVERNLMNVVLGRSQGAGEAMTEAYATIRQLTPDQQAFLGVRGVAAHLDLAALGLPAEEIAQNAGQMLNAMLAEENALIAKRAKLLQADASIAHQHASAVEQNLERAIKPETGESLAHFVVSQFPERIEYVCIAEENAFMLEGLDTMDKLLTEIRAKFPEREIVVVTSFLPNQQVLFPGNEGFVPRDYHMQVWNSALRNQMTVVGADISQPMEGAGFMKVTGEDVKVEVVDVSTAQTAVGQEAQRRQFMRLINGINRVNQFGLKSPLYILYGQTVNMLYNGFASVADDLAKSVPVPAKRMKVIYLAPTTGVDTAGNITGKTTALEAILPPGLGMRLSTVRAMAWAPDSGMEPFAGWDVRLKMERR